MYGATRDIQVHAVYSVKTLEFHSKIFGNKDVARDI
jgi:hypothetical protein